ncbi:MAG: asparaginase [Pseudomonadales bacterium]|nr:asparaginase [Pseudomonadales bacterium]
MTIQLFMTGGTIDKTYNELSGELAFDAGHSLLPQMLKQSRCGLDINCEELFLIDSLDMNDQHRETILQRCLSCESDQILISHGTDTMAETAALLASHIHDKTIILFGAMIPYKIKGSDALFNLGTAIAAVQQSPKGCYISMNGKVFDALNVSKNRQQGVFESTADTQDQS